VNDYNDNNDIVKCLNMNSHNNINMTDYTVIKYSIFIIIKWMITLIIMILFSAWVWGGSCSLKKTEKRHRSSSSGNKYKFTPGEATIENNQYSDKKIWISYSFLIYHIQP